MDSSDLNMEAIVELANQAGQAVMEIYESEDFDVETKDDDRESPLTRADQKAHDIIVAGLEELTPEITVISEEDESLRDYDQRRDLSSFWLVDPLDGTREFINQRDEFTVNIGLVRHGLPVAGVVVSPATNQQFWTDGNELQMDGVRDSRGVSDRDDLENGRFVTSRSHLSDELEQLLESIEIADLKRRGSSLKICHVAAGLVDVYCRFGPTWEWDTAAADAILRMAGGRASNIHGELLRYNKPPLKNNRGLIFSNGLLHETVVDKLQESVDEEVLPR